MTLEEEGVCSTGSGALSLGKRRWSVAHSAGFLDEEVWGPYREILWF